MGILNLPTVCRILHADGTPIEGAKRYIYHAGTDTLSPIYRDANLRNARSTPDIADDQGLFEICHLVEGMYRVEIVSPDGETVLHVEDDIRITAPVLTGPRAEFRTVSEMLADQSMFYAVNESTVHVEPGEQLRVAEGGFVYVAAAEEATDHHLETRAGLKLYVCPAQQQEFTVRQFGGQEDTDITDALQATINAALYNVERTGEYMARVLIDIHEGELSRTIHCGYGGHNYKTLCVRGLGSMYVDSVESSVGTVLRYTALSGCAISLQGGRRPRLGGFTLIGEARKPLHAFIALGSSPNQNGREFMRPERYDPKTWDTAIHSEGVVPNCRYAPYAGIAIDPRSGDRPSDLGIASVAVGSPAVITTAGDHGLNQHAPETVIISGLSDAGLPDGNYYAVTINDTQAELWQLDWTPTLATDNSTGSLSFPYYDAPPYPPQEAGIDPDTERKRVSAFQIEDVAIQGFEVGTVINPGTRGANGDYGEFRHVNVSHCKFAHAVCNPNARANLYFRSNPFGIYSYFSTAHFGDLQGNANARVEGVGGGYTVKLFEAVASTRMGACTFDSCHIEGLGLLGTFLGAGGGAGQPMTFVNSVLKFQHEWAKPPTLLENSRDPITLTFVGGELRTYSGATLLAQNVELIGTTIDRAEGNYPEQPYAALAFNNAQLCVAKSHLPLGIPVQKRMSISTLGVESATKLDAGLLKTGRDYGIPYFSRSISRQCKNEGVGQPVLVPPFVLTISPTQRSFAADAISGRSVTFTFATYVGNRMRHNGFACGGVLMDQKTGVRMVIRSVNYDTGEVVCTLESNWVEFGNGPELFDTSWDPTENNWQLFRTDLFTPPSQIFGDFTQGSKVITNIRTLGFGPESNFGLAVGDWLAARHNAPGVYLNDTTEITAIDTTASTITLGQNARTSLSGTPLDLWIRTPLANQAEV